MHGILWSATLELCFLATNVICIADDQGLCCAHRIWMSYMNPIFWSVYGLIISQVDTLDTACMLISGDVVPVYEAVLIIFGYQ